MRYVTGGGCLGHPFSVDAEGYREVIKGHSFKLKEPLQYDVESLFPLLAGVRPQDFPEPRLEAPQAEQALPPPDFPPELDPPVLPRNEVSPQPIADGAEGMDVDAGDIVTTKEPASHAEQEQHEPMHGLKLVVKEEALPLREQPEFPALAELAK